MGERFHLDEGWLAPILLAGMALSVALSIQAAGWTEGLQALRFVAVSSVVAGLLLARSHFSSAFAHLLSFVYGAFIIGYVMGSQPTIISKDWHGRIIELIVRLGTWANKLLTGGQSRDSLMFVVLMSIILWVLGYNAAWHSFRHHRVWLAILPIGGVLFLCIYYYYGPVSLIPYLTLYLVCALLFVIRSHLAYRERQWREGHVAFDPGMRLSVLSTGLVFSLLALLVASQTPTAEASRFVSDRWETVGGPWRAMQDEWSRMFSALKSYSQGSTDIYGRSLSLGGPVQLGDTLVMDVIVPQTPDSRLYWRAVTYDQFDGARWTDGSPDQKHFDPNDPNFVFTGYKLRQDVTQTITSYLPASSLLYVAPQPLWVGVDSTATFSVASNGQSDLSMLRANGTLHPGDTYQVVSSVTVADQASLRNAGEAYPDWIKNRYLQLPSSTTQRTRDLARQIVQGANANNPYDKAEAIQNWLRANVTYDLNVSAPPEGADAVDYVLFESRRGYCNYYASSMVVMLRSLGIPARMAAGYAQGAWNAKIGGYRVLERDAHSWPEVYFPAYGWVEFEPTASQSPIARPAGNEAAAEQAAGAQNSNQAENDQNSNGQNNQQNLPSRTYDPYLHEKGDIPAPEIPTTPPNWPVITVGILVVMGILALAFLVWGIERRGLKGLSLASQSYARLLRYAHWLGIQVGLAQTPYERAEALITVLPEGRTPIYHITDQFVQERFAHRESGVDAHKEWGSLRPLVLRGMARQAFEQFWTLPRKLRKREVPDV